MRKLTIAAFCILIFIQLKAQNIALSPEITLRATKYSDARRSKDWVTKQGIGINVVKFATNRFFYQAGLSYLHSSKIYNHQEIYDYVNGKFAPVGFYNFKYNYNYITVPIALNFLVFNKEGLNLLLSGGIEADWLYRTRVTIEKPENTEKSHWSGRLNKDNISLNITGGIGVYYPFSDNISIIVKPQVTKVVKSSDEMADIDKTYLGLNFQLIHKF